MAGQRTGDDAERLVLEHQIAFAPFEGVVSVLVEERHHVLLAVIDELLVRMNLLLQAIGLCLDESGLQRGNECVMVGIGLHIESSAEHPDVHLAGVDDEGVLGVVGHAE